MKELFSIFPGRLCAGSASLARGLQHIVRVFGWKATETGACDGVLNVSKDAHCSLPDPFCRLPGASCSETLAGGAAAS